MYIIPKYSQNKEWWIQGAKKIVIHHRRRLFFWSRSINPRLQSCELIWNVGIHWLFQLSKNPLKRSPNDSVLSWFEKVLPWRKIEAKVAMSPWNETNTEKMGFKNLSCTIFTVFFLLLSHYLFDGWWLRIPGRHTHPKPIQHSPGQNRCLRLCSWYTPKGLRVEPEKSWFGRLLAI